MTPNLRALLREGLRAGLAHRSGVVNPPEAYLDGLVDILDKGTPAAKAARSLATVVDPLCFALLYLRHHLLDDEGRVTLSDFHLDLAADARTWIRGSGFRQDRDAYIAPREVGKTTWLFLILPMWSAAHGHNKFTAAMADSRGQAEQHLQTFTTELDSNEKLQRDFPDLCAPATRRRVKRVIADNRGTTMRRNGFVFMARGLDSKLLGMKVGAARPDLMILDDVEPPEANYSAAGVTKRLGTIRNTVLPLNNRARVVLSGTVVMAGSIVHQLVQTRTTTDPPAEWIAEERFRVHYYPAIIEAPDGSERSVWPEKWPLEVLQGMRGTRSFELNFMNRPVGADGKYWTGEEFLYGIPPEGDVYGNTILSIDPAVTKTTTSDYTGFAIISRGPDNRRGRVYVRHAEHRKVAAKLRDRVLELLAMFPDVGVVYIETNQGGDTWGELLHGLPVRLRTVHQSEAKHVRAARALTHYERRRVYHTHPIPAAEDEMKAFPTGLNDDVLDAVVSGVLYFLEPEGAKGSASRAGGRTASYA